MVEGWIELILATEVAAMIAKSALWRTNRRRPVLQRLVQFQLPNNG